MVQVLSLIPRTTTTSCLRRDPRSRVNNVLSNSRIRLTFSITIMRKNRQATSLANKINQQALIYIHRDNYQIMVDRLWAKHQCPTSLTTMTNNITHNNTSLNLKFSNISSSSSSNSHTILSIWVKTNMWSYRSKLNLTCSQHNSMNRQPISPSNSICRRRRNNNNPGRWILISITHSWILKSTDASMSGQRALLTWLVWMLQTRNNLLAKFCLIKSKFKQACRATMYIFQNWMRK